MKTFLFTLAVLFYGNLFAQETVTLSGRATDFDGHPIDSCSVHLFGCDFNPIYTAVADKDGYYTMKDVKKGTYMALYAIRANTYPRRNAVPYSDMRLEFWGWNVIVDRDLTINPRCHRLELYGTTVFEQYGGYPGLFVYTRPMSLGKLLAYDKETVLNKEKADKDADISVLPDDFKVQVFADDEPLKVNSVQAVEEYVGEGHQLGYLIQVERPKHRPSRPYVIFRVTAQNTALGEEGENIYFYRLPQFE
jgi:hypothetical protein